jgi:hypothetical protein
MAANRSTPKETAEEVGQYYGRAAGTWVIDGNTPDTYCEALRDGYTNGAPGAYDIEPSPLSGEWSGFSLSEMCEDTGLDLYNDDIAREYEKGFSYGFWTEVMRSIAERLDA